MTGGRTGMTEGEPLSVMPDGSPITNVGDKRNRASSILSLPRHPVRRHKCQTAKRQNLLEQKAFLLLSPTLFGHYAQPPLIVRKLPDSSLPPFRQQFFEMRDT